MFQNYLFTKLTKYYKTLLPLHWTCMLFVMFCHVFQSFIMTINNKNIFILYVKLCSTNIALSNDTKFLKSLK